LRELKRIVFIVDVKYVGRRGLSAHQRAHKKFKTSGTPYAHLYYTFALLFKLFSDQNPTALDTVNIQYYPAV